MVQGCPQFEVARFPIRCDDSRPCALMQLTDGFDYILQVYLGFCVCGHYRILLRNL